MHARTRSIAILALLVVTAGCVGAPGVGDSPGTGIDDAPDGDTIATAHQDGLAAAGSYTYTAEAGATVDGRSAGSSSLSAAVDLNADRTLVETDTALGPATTYVESGTAYQRVGAEEPQYRTLDVNASAGEVVSTDVAPAIANHTFEANGTGAVNGQQVRTYEARATGSNATLPTDLGEGISVESVTVVLSVREDGVIVEQRTQAELALDGGETDGTYTRTVTYTDIGDTDVVAPDWVDDAREAGGTDA
ncbi:MAG: DUF7537 family lipoprotein [Halobacteriota archaeon]